MEVGMFKILKTIMYSMFVMYALGSTMVSAQTTDEYMMMKGMPKDMSMDTIYFPDPDTEGKVMVCYVENEYVSVCYKIRLGEFLKCVDANKVVPYSHPPYTPKTDSTGKPIPEQ
jgi:hypothetical protein